MSSTPKAVRRNGGYCVHRDTTRRIQEKAYDDGTCKRGYCFSAKCRECHGELFGIGPIECPCEHPRSLRYPGMRQPGHYDLERDVWVPAHVPVKPSTRKRRSK